MTTVINSPGTGDSGSNSLVGIIIGIIVLAVIVGLFFMYGLPAIRGIQAPSQNSTIDVNIKIPDINNSAPTQ